MNGIKIEMFPASQGDCFLLTIGEEVHILIDMGIEATYEMYLRQRLIELAKNGEKIDLLIITHIDEDHIGGAIQFFEENGSANNPNIIPVKEVWHNSYRHLQFAKEKVREISLQEKRIMKQIIGTYSPKNATKDGQKDISAEQGSTLASYLYAGEYNWNTSFDGQAVNCDSRNLINLTDQIRIHLLSPDTQKLTRLAKLWLSKLNEMKYGFQISEEAIFDDAFELYIRSVLAEVPRPKEIANVTTSQDIMILKTKEGDKDQSVPNGSSIAFILEYAGKRYLFLGDAHEDIIIEKIQRIIEVEEKKTIFEVAKLAHHGSLKNNSSLLLNLICAKYYLISTNGKNKRHTHPSFETIAKIVSKEGTKNLVFNYPHDTEAFFNNCSLMKEHNYTVLVGDGANSVHVHI